MTVMKEKRAQCVYGGRATGLAWERVTTVSRRNWFARSADAVFPRPYSIIRVVSFPTPTRTVRVVFRYIFFSQFFFFFFRFFQNVFATADPRCWRRVRIRPVDV